MKHKPAIGLVPGAVPFSPFEAFKQAVYRYGVPEMAVELGIKPGTLYNKCDADADSHAQPTLRDLIQVMRLAGDTTPLESLDRLFNRTAIDVGPLTPVSDAALLELMCSIGTEHGELYTAVNMALHDARFTRDELQRVRREAFDLVRAVMAFVQRLEGLVDD